MKNGISIHTCTLASQWRNAGIKLQSESVYCAFTTLESRWDLVVIYVDLN